MIDFEQYTGKVITIILTSGREILCEFQVYNDTAGTITVSNPRYVTYNPADGQANMVNLSVTSQDSTITMNTASVLAVMTPIKDVSEEYKKVVGNELAAQLTGTENL